jgi:hypothetical protein
MNKLLFECRDDEPIVPGMHVNRVEAWQRGVPEGVEWRALSSEAEGRHERHDVRHDIAVFRSVRRPSGDPVEAGMRALAGASDEVRLHSYMARRLAAFEQALEARVEKLVRERVEAAIAERTQAPRRVNPVLQNALERLRAKAERAPLPPADEVWRTINLLAPDEDED